MRLCDCGGEIPKDLIYCERCTSSKQKKVKMTKAERRGVAFAIFCASLYAAFLISFAHWLYLVSPWALASFLFVYALVLMTIAGRLLNRGLVQ